MLSFKNLEEITGGHLINYHKDLPVKNLVLDSRKLIASPGSVFFAIKGERHDGHKYLQELYSKGIKQFVVESNSNINPQNFPESNILQVECSITALQKIASCHRSKFHFPIIAVTG